MAHLHKNATNVFDTMTLGPMDTVTGLDIAPPLELQKRVESRRWVNLTVVGSGKRVFVSQRR